MNIRDTVELVGRLCRPKVVVVCRQASRLIYGAFPRTDWDSNEVSCFAYLNGVQHGSSIKVYERKVIYSCWMVH